MNIQKFQSEFGDVRTVLIDDEVWFVGKDIAKALGYKNTKSALNRHCKGAARYARIQTNRGIQKLRVIKEMDVYCLIFGSELPAAKAFKDLIVRKVPSTVQKYEDTDASRMLRIEKKLEVLIDESKEWATVKKVAIRTGRKFNWRRLKKVSEEMNLPPRKVFDANYGEVNAYHASVWLECFGIDIAEL